MKRILITLIGIIFTQFCSSQEFHAGGGITLGTQINLNENFERGPGFGVNLRGLYKFNQRWGLTGGFTFFLPESPEPIKQTAYNFNIDGTYSIVNNDLLDFYGLVGFNYFHLNIENTQSNASLSLSNLGPEFGIGLEFGLGVMTKYGIFFEAKMESVYEQGVLTLGYMHTF